MIDADPSYGMWHELTEEETARRAAAIHQVDWAFAVLLVVTTFSLNVYSGLPPPIGPAGPAALESLLYALGASRRASIS